MSRILIIISAAATLLFTACSEEPAALPKPRAYPKVNYPSKAYQMFDPNYCYFTFEQPVYAIAEHDSTYFEGKAGSDCWFNLNVPQLNATIHCSYYPIRNRAHFDELIQDAYEMAGKHNVKANYIEEAPFARPEAKVYGMVYNLEGPAASPYQFYVTDSTRHFLRGALYFRTQSRPDSLAPVTAFLKKDVNHLLQTLQWK